MEKADPEPLEKVYPKPKFPSWVKISFLTNLRVLISNTTIVFEDSDPNILKC